MIDRYLEGGDVFALYNDAYNEKFLRLIREFDATGKIIDLQRKDYPEPDSSFF